MGTSIPIKSVEEICLIKEFYKKSNRVQDLLLFTLAINTGMDLRDLLNLKVKDVKGKYYLILEKRKTLPLNNEVLDLISVIIEGLPQDSYVFRNSKGKKLDRTTVFYSFKTVCSDLGLNDKYSVSSWRKTFAYHYYEKYKDISYLMWLFNQHAVSVAFKFIDVQENMNLRYREGVAL